MKFETQISTPLGYKFKYQTDDIKQILAFYAKDTPHLKFCFISPNGYKFFSGEELPNINYLVEDGCWAVCQKIKVIEKSGLSFTDAIATCHDNREYNPMMAYYYHHDLKYIVYRPLIEIQDIINKKGFSSDQFAANWIVRWEE